MISRKDFADMMTVPSGVKCVNMPLDTAYALDPTLAAIYLDVADTEVWVRNDVGAANDIATTIYLPSVALAKGLTYSFTMTHQAGNAVCTVVSNGDVMTGISLTMETAEDHISIRSDGLEWHLLFQVD